MASQTSTILDILCSDGFMPATDQKLSLLHCTTKEAFRWEEQRARIYKKIDMKHTGKAHPISGLDPGEAAWFAYNALQECHSFYERHYEFCGGDSVKAYFEVEFSREKPSFDLRFRVFQHPYRYVSSLND